MITFKNMHEALLFRNACPICKKTITEENAYPNKDMEIIEDLVEPNERYIDIGCGRHYCISLIKKYNKNECVGVTLNFEMINIIKNSCNYTIILAEKITEISKKEADNSKFHEEVIFPKRIEDDEIYTYMDKYDKFLVVC